jgi:bifunctional DNA-binding transcriptional regulator/antitoxin component of YhaV-PrlF toxin-antitoxin module
MGKVYKNGRWTIPKNVREDLNIIAGVSDVTATKIGDDYFLRVTNSNPTDKVCGILKSKSPFKNTDELMELLRGDDIDV